MRFVKICLFFALFFIQFIPIKSTNISEMAQGKMERKAPKLTMKQSLLLNQVIAAYALDGMENVLCKNHTIKYKEGIRRFEPWALKMLDSSSKLQPGILTGNTGEFGSFDQCIKIRTLTEYGAIYGQMCAVDLIPGPKLSRHIIRMRNLPQDRSEQILNTITFNSVWMICLPDSCPYSDVQKHLNKTIQSMAEGLDLDVQVAEDACVSQRSQKPLSKYQWITL